MASTRKERMEQRLRGAQIRQVKETDFGLIFPAPTPTLEPISTIQTISNPKLPPQQSNRRSSTRAHGTTPSAKSIQEGNLPVVPQSVNDANTSAKRRKLKVEEGPSSSRSLRSLQAPARPDIYSLGEDEQRPSPIANMVQETLQQIVESQTTGYAPTPNQGTIAVEPVAVQAEATKSTRDAPGSSLPNRSNSLEAISESAELRTVLQASKPTEIEDVKATPINTKKRKRGEAIRKNAAPDISSRRSTRVNQVTLLVENVNNPSPEQPTRRGRTTKIYVHKKSSNADVNTGGDEAPEKRRDDEQDEAEAVDDEESAARLEKIRSSRISTGVHRLETPVLVNTEVPGAVEAGNRRGRQRLNSSPVQQRHPKKAKSKKNVGTSRKTPKNSKSRGGSPIPVTVHRLTDRPVYNEDDSDADILNSEIPHAKRGGVNSADVLSQICQEVISSGLDNLEGSANAEDSSLRREYRTKWRAVEAFGREIQTRLLDHTINLDNGHALRRRVRDEQRKRLDLREDILRIRAKRENVALRMDEIRIRHESDKQRAEEHVVLNTRVHDIELAIELGKSEQDLAVTNGLVQMADVELLLKCIAAEVSSKSDGGGNLSQFREFNAFLERTALALEAKKC